MVTTLEKMISLATMMILGGNKNFVTYSVIAGYEVIKFAFPYSRPLEFLSLTIYQGKYHDFLDSIRSPEKKILVFTPNPEILLRASKDEEFRILLSQADYLTPDANGLYVGAMMQEGSSFLLAGLRVLFSRKNLQMQYGELIS